MKTVMVIVFGGKCIHEHEDFYGVLKWVPEMGYDEILLVDKSYGLENDEKRFGVKHVKSIEFQAKPNVHYSLALNFDNKKGIARVLNRIKNGNVSFDIGVIWYGEYKPMSY